MWFGFGRCFPQVFITFRGGHRGTRDHRRGVPMAGWWHRAGLRRCSSPSTAASGSPSEAMLPTQGHVPPRASADHPPAEEGRVRSHQADVGGGGPGRSARRILSAENGAVTSTANAYCAALGILVPRIEDARSGPDANYYSLLLVSLLERGGPLTLEGAASRFEEAGVVARARGAPFTQQCRPARPTIYRDGNHYAFDPYEMKPTSGRFDSALLPCGHKNLSAWLVGLSQMYSRRHAFRQKLTRAMESLGASLSVEAA
jgi:hypothetical protein